MMMHEHSSASRPSLALAPDQPLVGVILDEDGREVVRYFADDTGQTESDETLRAALAVIGAWEDLDWEELAADLDRIRHESRPTPPFERRAGMVSEDGEQSWLST